ncbi:MAG: hypothetical protein J5596_01410 [Bacteroidaceae bacterium]|nr:hypothetical protein [Bacteroidaceae bacterium]
MHFSKFISVLFLFAILAGCSRVNDGMIRGRKAINSALDIVERTMDDNASYADSMVNLIDASSIHNKEQRARFALLYTAAEYKNYQLLTSDSLIMEAVRYYSISNNLQYRFLSYYYLGCAFVDMKMFPDASVALAQAEQLVNEIDNDYWKGLLYSQLGYVFNESCFFDRSEDYYSMAVSCFDRAGKTKHVNYALSDYAIAMMDNLNFKTADSIFMVACKLSIDLGDSLLFENSLYYRLKCMVHMEEPDSALNLIKKYSLRVDDQSSSLGYLSLMALYHNLMKNYEKSDLFLTKAWNCDLSKDDSIYMFYVSAEIEKSKGNMEESLESFRKYVLFQNKSIRTLLNHPATEAQESFFRTLAELEAIKARNRITVLIASIIISLLIISFIFLINLNRKRRVQEKIHDYLSTIDELRERDSENHDKIISLNSQVREMLRQQFTPSDYLYTRFYEQIDDNRKAEHLYRVVKQQIDQFTGPKSIGRIDDLLNSTFDGIMDKVLSSGLELKEKELLLLRFVLAGFSAKSIAAILDDTHANISQRKKRLLDKIQILSPEIMEEIRNILNIKTV